LRSNLATILIIRISLYCKIRICGNEQSCENIKRRNIIKIVKIVINKKTEENLENNLIEYLEKII